MKIIKKEETYYAVGCNCCDGIMTITVGQNEDVHNSILLFVDKRDALKEAKEVAGTNKIKQVKLTYFVDEDFAVDEGIKN